MDHNELSQVLPPQLRAAHQRTSQRLTPTLMTLRFGNTPALAKLTPEAERLASVADRAQTAWRDIHDTHWRTQIDQTATEAARLIRSATLAKGRIGSVSTALEDALTAAEGRLAQLKRTIDSALKPPTSAGEAMLDSEVRALIRSAKDATQAIAIARANPRAVATVPTELAGLAPDVHGTIRSEYLQATVPDEAAQYTDLLEAVSSARDAHRSLEDESRDLIDFDTAEKLEQHAKL